MDTKKTTSKETKGSRKGIGGRPSNYEEYVKPYIDDIVKWRRGGATDEQICEALGIGTSAFYNYQNKYVEFKEALKLSKKMLVMDLKGELARIAMPHEIRVTKKYKKLDLETGHETQYVETTTKEIDGNINAINALLLNFDREQWKRDWSSYELKLRQQNLNEAIAKEKYWLDDEDLEINKSGFIKDLEKDLEDVK